jgi:hypothetical protein
MRSGSEAFFQVAVALVPALVFGGAMRRRDQRWQSGGRARVVILILVVLGVAVSVAAEIFAIQGVIDPTVPRWKTRFVAFTIVGGTVVIAAATVWSWLGEDIQGALGTSGAGKSVAIAASLAAALACLVAASYFVSSGLNDSLDRVDARSELARADGRVRDTSAALGQADQAVTSARIAFITAIDELRPRNRERLSARVEHGIFVIDEIVQPVLKRERPSDGTIARAQAGLSAPIRRLRRPLYADLGTSRTDPEVHLAALAFDRFIRAEQVRLVAKQRNSGARRTLRRACRTVIEIDAAQVSLPGCPRPRG